VSPWPDPLEGITEVDEVSDPRHNPGLPSELATA